MNGEELKAGAGRKFWFRTAPSIFPNNLEGDGAAIAARHCRTIPACWEHAGGHDQLKLRGRPAEEVLQPVNQQSAAKTFSGRLQAGIEIRLPLGVETQEVGFLGQITQGEAELF